MGMAFVVFLTNFAAHKVAALCLSPLPFARSCIPSFWKVRKTEHQLWKFLSAHQCGDNVRHFLFPCLQMPPPGLSKMGTFYYLFIFNFIKCLVLVGKGGGTSSWKWLEMTWRTINLSLNLPVFNALVNFIINEGRENSWELFIPPKSTTLFLFTRSGWIDHWTSYQAPLAELQLAFMLQKLMAFIHANHFPLSSSRKCSACFQDYF